jgi:hypothetical protein
LILFIAGVIVQLENPLGIIIHFFIYLDALSVDVMMIYFNDLMTIQDADKPANHLLKTSITAKQIEDMGVSLPITRTTAWRWMHALGARRGLHRKCYYTDRHEDPDVKEYRKWYISSMNVLEMRMYHWVIISCEEHETFRSELTKDGLPNSDFPTPRKQLPGSWLLFHMDDLSIFDDVLKYPRVLHPDWTTLPLVEGREDWYREKPEEANWICHEGHSYATCLCHVGHLVHWGQDESCYHSFDLRTGCWEVMGVIPLHPKSDGPGIMVSSYVCSEMGFGANGRTAEQLVRYVKSIYSV